MAPGVVAYYEKGHEFFKDNKWHNFVYVYGKADNSPYEHGLYIDGERVPLRYGAGTPTTTITFPSVTQWFIGNRTSDYAFEDMYCADVMFYRQPLSDEEIKQNYEAQKNRFASESAIRSSKVYPSAKAIKQENPSAKSGLYWIQAPGFEPQLLFCDMEYHGGGWMLVCSSNARDTTIPGGTGRNTADYELDRPTPLVGTDGISPNGDYIIGRSIQTLPFDEARVWAFGRSSTNSTYNWFGNRGTQVVAIWNLESKGTSRLSEVQPRANITVYGSLSSSAAYFSIDGVKKDREDGGSYTANSNQSTVGGVGTQGASGDPTTGCYLGHGSGEGSWEGWYDAGNAAADCQGYTTWVR
jgi:hypothetical protein